MISKSLQANLKNICTWISEKFYEFTPSCVFIVIVMVIVITSIVSVVLASFLDHLQ